MLAGGTHALVRRRRGRESGSLIRQIQGDTQGVIHRLHFGRRKRADEVGEDRLGQADQPIAVNTAVVFQAFIGPNGDLRGQSVMRCVDRRTDDG